MPKASVILPVYNGGRFLKKAIDSILQQTFTDFELLIINDGSTDDSEAIIRSYTDARIVYLKNETNRGLIYSLNSAVEMAKGAFIARMDADDIALPERLEKQLAYLEKNKPDVLFTRVHIIDADGNSLPDWRDDRKQVTGKQIKNFLPKDNCLAHPTAMAKASLFKKYPYRTNQKFSEDYDLWLRMMADGRVIEKLNEPLLLYRELPGSATRSKKINVFLRLAKVKFRFVRLQIRNGKPTAFVLKVLLYASFDMVKAAAKEIKRFTK